MEKCAGIVGTLSQLWENGTDAERSEMIHDLFDEIVVNVDTRRITSFKLKLWADQFLTVRASLYEVENQKTPPEIGTGSEFIGSDTAMPPQGYDPIARLTPLQAVRRVLYRLYDGIPLPSTLQPNKTQKQSERNAIIRRRYAAGESLVDLATEFGLSKQRIHQIATDPDDVEGE